MKRQRTLIGLSIVGLLLALAASAGPSPARSGPPRLDASQAIVAAVNDLEPTAAGYRLRHPHHTATFTPDGLEFAPRDGGPAWAWRLTAVAAAGDKPLAGVEAGAVRPVHEQPLTVAYPRGGVVEQYLAKKDTVEQRFLIPRPLPLGGADLVIAGAVRSDGDFEETEDGWRWRTGDGGVRLGRVRVYDARGAVLPATMAVTARTTRIAVAGAALAQAAYPVTVDPEIGQDFILSNVGPYWNPDYDAYSPAVAYNSVDNEYLVVWSGDNDVDNKFEIWGQRVDAATGAQIRGDFRISLTGPPSDPDYDAEEPDVAYNSTDNEYLVVWSADGAFEGKFGIWGQRVNAATGAQIGGDFQISYMGPLGDPDYDARSPAVAYNSTDNWYLVVWEGDTDLGGLVDGEFEIWGRQLNADGAPVRDQQLRISFMGGSGDANYDAFDPDVTYNSTENQYLVVWEGDTDLGDLLDGEFEIWFQAVDARAEATWGPQFMLSGMGPWWDADYDALDPAVAYNSANNEYLVVWEGDDDADDKFEIWGQRLSADGTQVGQDDFRLSDHDNGPYQNYDALDPAVAYDRANNQYLVVWRDDELGAGEDEIFGQRVSATGAQLGGDTRLSDMGPDGDASYDARAPAVAYSSVGNNEYLVVWRGDDTTDDEFEIWGQHFVGAYKAYLPLVLRGSP